MVWLYYTSILLLIGAEINSQVYNKISRKANEIRDDLNNLKKLKLHKTSPFFIFLESLCIFIINSPSRKKRLTSYNVLLIVSSVN